MPANEIRQIYFKPHIINRWYALGCHLQKYPTARVCKSSSNICSLAKNRALDGGFFFGTLTSRISLVSLLSSRSIPTNLSHRKRGIDLQLTGKCYHSNISDQHWPTCLCTHKKISFILPKRETSTCIRLRKENQMYVRCRMEVVLHHSLNQ